jgi:hypothetical protein
MKVGRRLLHAGRDGRDAELTGHVRQGDVDHRRVQVHREGGQQQGQQDR